MTTDTSEAGLENLIVTAMTGAATPMAGDQVRGASALYAGTGWLLGSWKDYDREHAADLEQLGAFLAATQPKIAEAVGLESESPTRQKFLARLQGEITKRGVIDVLRHGIKHGALNVDLFYGTPSPGNEKAPRSFPASLWSIAWISSTPLSAEYPD